MRICIFGGSAGGKSGYAGRMAEKLAAGRQILYIATMPGQGDEAKAKIRRHERLRQNGNYEVRLCLTFGELEQAAAETQAAVILLDSLDGFLADVMFAPDSGGSPLSYTGRGRAEEEMVRILKRMDASAEHVIVVADDFFRDGTVYDRLTEEYIELTGRVFRRACRHADAVAEVICGIPVLCTSLRTVMEKQQGTIYPGRRIGTEGEWYEFFEIPYHDDINLHQDPHAGGGVER